VDQTGRWLLVANYASGSAAVFPIGEDGRLGQATDVVQHHGSSIVPDRQGGPHAHSVTLSPDNRFALVADLGMDKVMIYRFDGNAGRLIPNDPPSAAFKPGTGPRHLAFHPTLPLLYVTGELGNTMTAFAWDAATGAMREVQSLSTLPPGFTGENFCADVHVHPLGRFLYGSNRGHDSIVVFGVDASTGLLSPIAYEPTLGKWPRNFAIDPTGAWLLAAHQESDSIVVFRIDVATGRLLPAGVQVAVSMPVCLKAWPG
jgi:6-phosphogluconolactonase